MLHLADTPTAEVRELLDEELSDLDLWVTTEQMDWCVTFIVAALDEAPGYATDGDVEDATYDALGFLLLGPPSRIRTLPRHWVPDVAGRAWARIRNGSGKVLVSEAFTGAARDLGRLRLG